MPCQICPSSTHSMLQGSLRCLHRQESGVGGNSLTTLWDLMREVESPHNAITISTPISISFARRSASSIEASHEQKRLAKLAIWNR